MTLNNRLPKEDQLDPKELVMLPIKLKLTGIGPGGESPPKDFVDFVVEGAKAIIHEVKGMNLSPIGLIGSLRNHLQGFEVRWAVLPADDSTLGKIPLVEDRDALIELEESKIIPAGNPRPLETTVPPPASPLPPEPDTMETAAAAGGVWPRPSEDESDIEGFLRRRILAATAELGDREKEVLFEAFGIDVEELYQIENPREVTRVASDGRARGGFRREYVCEACKAVKRWEDMAQRASEKSLCKGCVDGARLCPACELMRPKARFASSPEHPSGLNCGDCVAEAQAELERKAQAEADEEARSVDLGG